MPETDVLKMKVADLKRELKLRGLVTTGNKTELQDRLQTALLDGELSLEDTAISGEDLLDGEDEDAVLTDEDEAKILGADENELLKSPTTTPITAPDLTLAGNGKNGTEDAATDDILENIVQTTSTTTAKKIVLKRKSSFTTIGGSTGGSGVAESAVTIKGNNESTAEKVPKMSERNPITISSIEKPGESKDKATAKVAQLSNQERLEMRAKKFGIAGSNNNNGSISATATIASSDSQIEMLKKRAERFGCVVSSKIAKIDAEEKLLKRKERFGGSGGAGISVVSKNDDNKSDGVWAEKARQRLERFKTAPAVSTTPVTVTTTVAAATATADN